MRYTDRVYDVINDPSATAYLLNEEAKADVRSGVDGIISLAEVDCDLPMPRVSLEATITSLIQGNYYTSPQGTNQLTETIAQWESRKMGVAINSSQVVVFSGAQNALVNAIRLLVSEGTPVIVADPMYATFHGSIVISGGVILRLPRKEDLSLDFDAFLRDSGDYLRNYHAEVRPVFLLCSPDNPTGAIISIGEMVRITQICNEYDINLIFDGIYSGMAFDARFVSPMEIPDLRDRTIYIDGLSKWPAMPGMRVGWTISNSEAASALVALAEISHISLPPFAQAATFAALTGEGAPELPGYKQEFRERRDLICSMFAQNPRFSFTVPQGGMYLLLYVNAVDVHSEQFCRELYVATKVVTVPGSGFGISATSFRISLTTPKAMLVQGVSRILNYVNNL